MNHIYFQKLVCHEGLGGAFGSEVSEARCAKETVIALECYSPGTMQGYPKAARLWLYGQRVSMDVADYTPFEKVFGYPVSAAGGRKVLVNMDNVVAEIVVPGGVECVLACRMESPVFQKYDISQEAAR